MEQCTKSFTHFQNEIESYMKIYDTWPQLSRYTKHSLFSTVCFHFPNRYFFLCSEWDFVHPCKLMKGILSTIANHEGFLSTLAKP